MSPSPTTGQSAIRKRDALARGLRKRCPHCGRGPLFRKRVEMHEHCSECGLRFQRNRGDAWGFLLLIDRAAFIFPLIAAIYFGHNRVGFAVFAVFAAFIGIAFVLTAPNRYGLCIAIDYLMRVTWRDPSDELPEPPGDGEGG